MKAFAPEHIVLWGCETQEAQKAQKADMVGPQRSSVRIHHFERYTNIFNADYLISTTKAKRVELKKLVN